MLFNSEIFLFVFLPLTLILFYTLGSFGRVRLALATLVVASFIYYAWWNPIYLPLILGSTVANYAIGIAIQRWQARGRSAKSVLVAGVAANLGLLGYFKYANFFVDNLNLALGSGIELAPIILPLAISFFTFQQIAYLVDVYQRKVRENDLLDYALFVTFFPQLIAGPIVHHIEMMPQFASRFVARFKLENLVVGTMIFFLGLFKKVVLADNVAPLATNMFSASASGEAISFMAAWTGALAYTCQIYFDFSGYSDMAVGIGRMFGIALPLNFDSPYKATGIIDFWRRWHMTLSRFLRDYLYIPLGGNRLGSGRRYVNMLTVMLLGGLWHGAGWTFVMWGCLHGLYLAINHAWRSWRGHRMSDAPLAVWSSRMFTFLLVVIAWVFFRAENFESAISILSAMAGIESGVPTNLSELLTQLDKRAWLWITALLCISWFAPNSQQFMRDYMNIEGAPPYRIDGGSPALQRIRWAPIPVSAVVLAVITAITIMSLWQPSEFIYYQF